MALGYGLDDWGSKVRFPACAGNFSLHHRVQNGSGAHLASYPSSAEVKECVELYLHSPNTPSWGGAELKHRDNFALTFTFTCNETCNVNHLSEMSSNRLVL
jgi:hypothetical protein